MTGEPPFHTLVWVAWGVAALAPTALTRNPWYLVGLLAVAAAVHRGLGRIGGDDPERSRAWGTFLRFGMILGLLTLGINLLFGGAGATRLFALPRLAWETTWGGREVTLLAVGGPVTLEALAHGLVSALALMAVLTVLATFNLSVDHYQLVRRVPRFLDQAGTVVSIALAFIPEMVTAQREIREALALRGYRMRRLRDLPPLLLALLAEGLERSMTLAESMEARGFHRRRRPRSLAAERALRLSVLLALGLLAAGSLLRAEPARRTLATGLLLTGSLVLLTGLWRLDRGVTRSRYRRESWGARDTLLTAASLAALGLFLGTWLARRSLLVYELFPRAHWPGFHPLPAAAVLLLLAPLVAVVREPRRDGR